MTENPIKIEKGTVFICGKASEIEVAAFQEFADFEAKLKAKGIKCINMHTIFDNLDTESFTISECVNRCAAYLVMCDKVVTLNNWQQCFNAQSLINVARALTKTIVHADRFLELIEKESQNVSA
jgi:hypothetical protein